VAPVAGIVAFHAKVDALVKAGERIADIVDPLTGAVTPVEAGSSGVFYARVAARFTPAGRLLGTVAGTTAHRRGKLLGP
jgi:uncharacterized protein